MLPSPPTVFPKFEPDQLLTSENLNQLFGYLDEQGRMTRTNLLGVGIVCGLELQINTATPSITITKGTGVTTKGYLVTMDTTTYEEYIDFDAVKPEYYNKFVNNKTQKFPLWELKKKAAVPGSTKLDNTFLEDKLVLIFVELLEEDNKNCNPNSCDDKGILVTVTFRPLLVAVKDVSGLLSGSGWSAQLNTTIKVPELVMRRWDVPNIKPVRTKDIFEAYHKILSPLFFKQAEKILSETYVTFTQLVKSDFPADPFKDLAKKFEFIEDGSLTTEQLIHIQYIYDLFSDLCYAYKEFRKSAMEIMAMCCPDENMFPRHLLLGAASTSAKAAPNHRHNFIYSPLFQKPNLVGELRSLFKRLASLVPKFFLPDTAVNKKDKNKVDTKLRITPSKFGDVPLSEKSIPYYYKVTAPDPLYKFWNHRANKENVGNRILSWHADGYNNTDDYVIHPLLYDLEPYNFLRVEGHIGKQYVNVLQNIKKQISQYRLPVNVVALSTDVYKPTSSLSSANRFNAIRLAEQDQSELMRMMCHFQDLEALYDSIKNEMLCTLCKELKYYYDFKMSTIGRKTDANGNIAGTVDAAPELSQVPLFDQCTSKGYMVKPNTFGFYFEKVYRAVGEDTDLTLEVIAEALGLEELINSTTHNQVNLQQSGLVGFIVNVFEIPMGIIRLASSFTSSLNTFDPDEYCRLHKRLVGKAESIKFLFNIFTGSTTTVEEEKKEDVAKPAGATGAATADAAGVKTSTDQPAPAAGALRTEYVSLSSSTQRAAALALSSASLQSNALVSFVRGILMIEDLLDHLDVLIYNCKCSALKAIKAEYLKRVAYVTLLRQFGYFTKLHPGIQHKAGVTMGGTFIIVYHIAGEDSRDETFTQVLTGNFTLNGKVRDASGAVLPGVVVKIENTNKAATTNASGNFTIKTNTLPVTLTVSFPGFGQQSALISSEKDENLNIVLGQESADNEEGEDILANIADGTVIADFYLPYLIFSDCPPINYIVPEIKEDDTRTIQLEPNKATGDNTYCSNDEQNYKFTTVPADCDIQPRDGVDQNGTEFVFIPIKVDLKGQQNVVINFIASKDGISSSPLAVTVYQSPVADFDFAKTAASPRSVQFTNKSQFATDFTWDFGDNTPVDNSKDPLHTYELDAEYKVTLTVKNVIEGCSQPAVKEVPVKTDREQPVTKCLPLEGLVDDFNNLNKIDPQNFGIFKEQFKEYGDVEAFFKELPKIIGKPAADQVNFFGNQDIVARLQKWLASLFSLISGDNLKLRMTALELYRILVNLVMYIACFQAEDVNAAKIPMNNILELILSHMRIFRRLVLNFTDKERAIMKRLRDEMLKEMDRLKNNEVVSKPVYESLLIKITEMMKAMTL